MTSLQNGSLKNDLLQNGSLQNDLLKNSLLQNGSLKSDFLQSDFLKNGSLQSEIKKEDIDINEMIINILEDHGYTGLDLLNQVVQIYNIYQDKHIKQFILTNFSYFTILKDTIWYNFEHSGNKLGIVTLKDFGTKFPNVTHLFDGVNIIPYIYLPELAKEIEKIIDLWNKSEIILANIYTDSDVKITAGEKAPSKVIIYNYNENPRKYLKNSAFMIDEDQLIFCRLLGKINKETDGKVLYGILIDLQDSVNNAILYHKDLSLVIEESSLI